MKLFTLFTNEERAKADVTARSASIARTFDRLREAREWGVRISFDPAAARGANPSGPGDGPVSGRDFLVRKKERREAAAELARSAEQAVEEVYRALAARARDDRRREPIPEAGA